MKLQGFCAIVAWAMASLSFAADRGDQAMRYVADTMEVATLPNGETVTRLVSRSRVTAGQFWADSVYGKHQYLVVFGGNREQGTPDRSMARGADNTRLASANPRHTVTQTNPSHASELRCD